MKTTKISYSASIDIAVTPAALFDLITEEERYLDLRPGALEHHVVERFEIGGHACTQVFKWGRRMTTLSCATVDFDPPRRVVEEVEGTDYSGVVTNTLEQVGAVTRLTVSQEFNLRKALDRTSRFATEFLSKRRLLAALRQIQHIAESGSGR